MNRDDYVRVIEKETDVTTRLTYFALGGAIGALVALLFAPKSGHELRGDIADVTRKGVDRTRETATQLGTKATEYYDTTRDRATELASTAYATATQKANELADSAREVVTRKGDQVSAAVEAGKQAYHEEKQRLPNSGAQDALGE